MLKTSEWPWWLVFYNRHRSTAVTVLTAFGSNRNDDTLSSDAFEVTMKCWLNIQHSPTSCRLKITSQVRSAPRISVLPGSLGPNHGRQLPTWQFEAPKRLQCWVTWLRIGHVSVVLITCWSHVDLDITDFDGVVTLWLWLTVCHGIDGPNRNRWFT